MTDEPIGLPTATAGQLRSARRLLQRKQRDRSGHFLVEGPQAVRECLATAASVFVAPGAAARHADLVSAARAAGVAVLLTDDVGQLSDSATPQGIVAVHPLVTVGLRAVLSPPPEGQNARLEDRDARPSDAVGTPRLLVIAAQIRDPGNLGTVIRCADAFGADGVILTSGSVDPHNPKTVRASVGSLFHLPIVTGVGLAEAVDACHAAAITVLAADGSGADDLAQLATAGELARPTAWLFGNEAWGLPDEDRELADTVVRIPMWGAAESLNLSTAAAVCLYTTAAAQRAVSLSADGR